MKYILALLIFTNIAFLDLNDDYKIKINDEFYIDLDNIQPIELPETIEVEFGKKRMDISISLLKDNNLLMNKSTVTHKITKLPRIIATNTIVIEIKFKDSNNIIYSIPIKKKSE